MGRILGNITGLGLYLLTSNFTRAWISHVFSSMAINCCDILHTAKSENILDYM